MKKKIFGGEIRWDLNPENSKELLQVIENQMIGMNNKDIEERNEQTSAEYFVTLGTKLNHFPRKL